MAFGLRPQPNIRLLPKSAATACTASKPLEASHRQKTRATCQTGYGRKSAQSAIKSTQIHHFNQPPRPIPPLGHKPASTRAISTKNPRIRGRFLPEICRSVDKSGNRARHATAGHAAPHRPKRFETQAKPTYVAQPGRRPFETSLPDVYNERGLFFPGPEGVPGITLASSKVKWALESPHFLGTRVALGFSPRSTHLQP